MDVEDVIKVIKAEVGNPQLQQQGVGWPSLVLNFFQQMCFLSKPLMMIQLTVILHDSCVRPSIAMGCHGFLYVFVAPKGDIFGAFSSGRIRGPYEQSG